MNNKINPYFIQRIINCIIKDKNSIFVNELEELLLKYENKKELNSWISKYHKPLEYVVSEKLDGIFV